MTIIEKPIAKEAVGIQEEQQDELINRTRETELHCVSMYRNSTSKVLVQPRMPRGIRFTQTELQRAMVTENYVPNACRIKFDSHVPWSDYQGAGVKSRHLMMDLLHAMECSGKDLICCADINRFGLSAGSLFFQDKHQQQQQQQQDMVCISFHNFDKVRTFALPEIEASCLEKVILESWKSGIEHKSHKYGVPEYKLRNCPWLTNETSNAQNIDARILMMAMLKLMWNYGWQRAVPVDCTVSGHDIDSLVFYRSTNYSHAPLGPSAEFCCLALERRHKIRLIGTRDPETVSAFPTSVATHWPQGTKETNEYYGTIQVKCYGNPWLAYTTPEAIASATLVCGLLEEMSYFGWKLLCAMDMSRSSSDKSTLFFVRCAQKSTSTRPVMVGCLQPKGLEKINLVRFPSHLLNEVLSMVQSAYWCPWGIEKIDKHNANTATIKFATSVHCGRKSREKAALVGFYLPILTKILNTAGAEFLGCADISGCTTGGDSPSPADTDVFFFSFQRS